MSKWCPSHPSPDGSPNVGDVGRDVKLCPGVKVIFRPQCWWAQALVLHPGRERESQASLGRRRWGKVGRKRRERGRERKREEEGGEERKRG